ncbi:RNA polymerase sigma factor [Segatella copri]|uniref:RNA polymerase sigma factor n=1 Tax=Segatella copri TaxID=165179 RepID=UPI003F88666C
MTEENEQRMERLFHDHYEQMYRFAFALLHDNEETRDVVSDVFSRLWDKQLVPDRAYLMRSVKNACINLIARKKRDERQKRLLPLSEEKLTEEEPSRLEERWQGAVDCIDHDLTDQTASVIRLCYREGMSYSDYEVKEDGKHVGKVKYDDDESRTILGPVHEVDAMS